jgi:hypothetical protein
MLQTINVIVMKTLKSLSGYAGVLFSFCLFQTTNAQTLSLTVTANPLWTDTGIYLLSGQSVTATASGSWNPWTGVVAPCGPDGAPTSPDWNDSFLQGINCASLIAYVGTDPFQGHWGDPTFWPRTSGYWEIGSSGGFTSPSTGELWFGFNDDAVTENAVDNSGSVTAEITVVPEPSTFALAGLAGLGLLAFSRRKKI